MQPTTLEYRTLDDLHNRHPDLFQSSQAKISERFRQKYGVTIEAFQETNIECLQLIEKFEKVQAAGSSEQDVVGAWGAATMCVAKRFRSPKMPAAQECEGKFGRGPMCLDSYNDIWQDMAKTIETRAAAMPVRKREIHHSLEAELRRNAKDGLTPAQQALSATAMIAFKVCTDKLALLRHCMLKNGGTTQQCRDDGSRLLDCVSDYKLSMLELSAPASESK